MFSLKSVTLTLLTALFLSLSACTPNVRAQTIKPDTKVAVATVVLDDKDFIGDGSAPEFAEAKNSAYSDLLKKAVVYLIGDAKYQQNKGSIDGTITTYTGGRKYVLGETEKTTPDKQKKWISNSRDANGNLVLRLQAYINLKKLKTDLDSLGMKAEDTTTTTVTTTKTEDTKVTAVINPVVTASSSAAPAEDLSNVDISSLSFLVFYNPKDPALKNDSDQETYAKWAVDNLNREVASLNIQTFDLDTMEKLASERELLQEADTGNAGIGLLLAQKVFAELYAEISPSVTYQGTKAHVILTMKVYVRTTGALIATLEKGGKEYDSASLNASIKISMREAAKKIITDLSIALKKYVNNGRFYFVRLTGVKSYKDASKFSGTASKLDGVVNMTLKSGSKQDMVYDYQLQYKGNPTEAVDKLFDALTDKPGFEKFDLKEIRGNELIFTLD